MAKFGTKSGAGVSDMGDDSYKSKGGSCFNDKKDDCTGNTQSVNPHSKTALNASLIGRPSFDASAQAEHGGAGHNTDCY